MDINQLTLGQIRELKSLFTDGGSSSKSSGAWAVGDMYLIRTVTMAVTGRLISCDWHELLLADAAWVADTGVFSTAVLTGDFAEVEPFPDGRTVIVGRGAVVDAVAIPKLPRERV